MRSVDLVPPEPRAAPPPTGLFLAVLALTPALAWAHERWIPNTPRFPINRAYFQSMSGEVLLTSLGATLALFGVVLVWYLLVPSLVDAVGTSAATASSAQESPLRRVGRYLFRLALDGDVPGSGFARAQRISAFVFTRIPAFVLGLGGVGDAVRASQQLEEQVAFGGREGSVHQGEADHPVEEQLAVGLGADLAEQGVHVAAVGLQGAALGDLEGDGVHVQQRAVRAAVADLQVEGPGDEQPMGVLGE